MQRLCVLLAAFSLVGCADALHEVPAGQMHGESSYASSVNSAEPLPQGNPKENPDQKIVYDANVTISVEDFDAATRQLPKTVEQFEGYYASISVDRRTDGRPSGQWVVRIPVESLQAFLDALSEMGEREHETLKAQDVTATFVDLQARIAAKQRLEQRVLDLLDKSKGSIHDIIEVERELGRVRADIEQMQGQSRYLTNKTSLTTVTIHLYERQAYVPPEEPETPGFFVRVSESWNSSIAELQRIGANLAVALVYLAPWLFIALCFLIPLAVAAGVSLRKMGVRISAR